MTKVFVLALAYDAGILLSGKTFLKSCARWSAVAMGKLYWTIKFVTITSPFKTLFLKNPLYHLCTKKVNRFVSSRKHQLACEKAYCNAVVHLSNPSGGKLSSFHKGGNETCTYHVSLLLSGVMLPFVFKWNLVYFWTSKLFFWNSCCCSCASISIFWFVLFRAIVLHSLRCHFEQ